MTTRLLCIALFFCFSMTACMSSRCTTHWIINNDSDKDVSLDLNVYRNGVHHYSEKHTVKPGLQQLAAETFSIGSYAIEAKTTDGMISNSKQIYLDSETWLIVNFTSADSSILQRKYGYIDTASLKIIDGKFTSVNIYKENRKPPFLYNFTAKK